MNTPEFLLDTPRPEPVPGRQITEGVLDACQGGKELLVSSFGDLGSLALLAGVIYAIYRKVTNK